MLKHVIASWLLWMVLSVQSALGGYSSIVEATGTSCEAESTDAQQLQLALTDARRNAAEVVQTSVNSYSKVANYMVIDDLIESYSNAAVKTLDVLSQQVSDGCVSVTIRAEVTPEKNIDQQFVSEELLADPTIPLTVKLWLSKDKYAIGENVSIYVKANKPFFGRLVYTMNDGTQLQLLPNPYRREHHFQGQVLYTVPDANDEFVLEVTPPVGAERLTLYASTHPLGDVDKSAVSGLYVLSRTQSVNEIANRTRGIKITALDKPSANPTMPSDQNGVAEFAEVTADVIITQ